MKWERFVEKKVMPRSAFYQTGGWLTLLPRAHIMPSKKVLAHILLPCHCTKKFLEAWNAKNKYQSKLFSTVWEKQKRSFWKILLAISGERLSLWNADQFFCQMLLFILPLLCQSAQIWKIRCGWKKPLFWPYLAVNWWVNSRSSRPFIEARRSKLQQRWHLKSIT